MFDDPLDEDRKAIGGNNPPGPIENAKTAFEALSDFLTETPVISDEKAAKLAKLFNDRTKATLGEVEDALENEATPLRKKWEDARAKYTPSIKSLQKLLDELNSRVTAYLKVEKAKAEEIARKAAEELAEKERIAREAEAKEREAKENASVGEIVDVGASIQAADAAFADYQQTSRFAARAEKAASRTRLGGGWGKAMSLKTRKVIILQDASKALAAVGLSDDLRACFITQARKYKADHGALPDGFAEVEEEKV